VGLSEEAGSSLEKGSITFVICFGFFFYCSSLRRFL